MPSANVTSFSCRLLILVSTNCSDMNIAVQPVSLSIFTGLLSTNPSMIFNPFVNSVSVSVHLGTTGIYNVLPLCCCFFGEYSKLLACLGLLLVSAIDFLIDFKWASSY